MVVTDACRKSAEWKSAEWDWICFGCAAPLLPERTALRCASCGVVRSCREGIWDFSPGTAPPGFSPARRDHLAGLETGHFWFPARQRLLEAQLERVPARDGAAIELGCGGGGFLPVLAAQYRRVVAIDAYRASLTRARTLTPSITLIEGDVCRVPLGGDQFEVAVALDVLEHVAPAAFLAEARRLVRRDGWLLLSVPASPALWSGLDEAAGHRCRYRRRALERELAESGWRLAHWTHYQALLYPAVWLSRRLEGRRAAPLERHPPRALGRVLGAVNALEVGLFARRRLPFGTSLVALAQRAA